MSEDGYVATGFSAGSKILEDRVYHLADIVKTSFEEVVFECDQPENNAAGGQPDDGPVFHAFNATIPSFGGFTR